MFDNNEQLKFYSSYGPLTTLERYEQEIDELPSDVGTLVKIVTELGIYDVVAKDFYNVELNDEREDEIHIRRAEDMFKRIFLLSDSSLNEKRNLDQRIACRCHAFTKLIVSILRSKGIPARSRCGFATYLTPNRYEDHWVCEYWNKDRQQWIIVDAQIDKVWNERLGNSINFLDINKEQFISAGDAWQMCRKGIEHPEKFGISFYEGLKGLWFIAGNLIRDIAALNKYEMLPWDIWGAIPWSNIKFSDDQLNFFDKLAILSSTPNESFSELKDIYNEDTRVRVSKKIFNNTNQCWDYIENL